MTLATIHDNRAERQGRLVLLSAGTGTTGQPGERRRPPDDATASCHAVTGPMIPVAPNRAVTAVVANLTAVSRSLHPEPAAFGTCTSTPADKATCRKCSRTCSSRPALRRNPPRTVDSGTPSSKLIRR
jgi:hypothetical protein